jgi:hypothetical protein
MLQTAMTARLEPDLLGTGHILVLVPPPFRALENNGRATAVTEHDFQFSGQSGQGGQ